jgi:hypothetical protein
MKVTLIDGAYHEVDSSAIAFEIATRAAMREAFDTAGAVLLEPMMKVEVTSPEEFVGSVIGDLNSRRGQIVGTSMRGNANIINALGAARQHVRLHQQPALHEPGPRVLHDAIRPLCPGSGRRGEEVKRNTPNQF